MIEEKRHARFSPSQLPRMLLCPGSAIITQQILELGRSSSAAAEGTRLHAVTEECLRRAEFKVHDILIEQYRLSAEQIQVVQLCLDFAKTLVTTLLRSNAEISQLIELTVSMAGYAERFNCPELIDVSGTSDYCIHDRTNRTLYVVDWKFGLLWVSPDSAQLKAYAVAKMKNHKYARERFDKVVLIVGQPRTFGEDKFRRAEFTVDELLRWAEFELVPKLKNATSGSPSFCVDTHACKYCLGRNFCEERSSEATASIESLCKEASKIKFLSIEELTNLLKKEELVKEYYKDIREQLFAVLNSGAKVSGFRISRTKPTRKWKDEKKVEEFLKKNGFDDSQLYERKLKSPAKLEKLIGAKAATAEFKDLWHKPLGSEKLVSVDETETPKPLQKKTTLIKKESVKLDLRKRKN